MSKTIILVRHARTAWNVEGKIQGHTGADLDEIGRFQAADLAQRLAKLEVKISRILCSTLPRAMQTGEAVGNRLGLPLIPEERLWECGFGSLEGLTHAEVIERHGPELEPHLDHRGFGYDFRSFGGEHHEGVLQRHLQLLQDLSENGHEETYVLIGHGRALNTLLIHRWPQIALIDGNCEYRIVLL